MVTLPGPPAIFVRADAHLRMWGIAQYNAASPTPAMFLVMRKRPLPREFIVSCRGRLLMDTPTTGSLAELTVNERLIAHGAGSTVTRRSRPKSCLGARQYLPSYGLSVGSLRRQWRTLTYAFVPQKAFERIPDASTPSRPLIRLL